MAEMSRLRRWMIEDMTIRNLSPATQRSYLHAVSKFSRIPPARRIGSGWKTSAPTRCILISKGISWASLNQVTVRSGSVMRD